MDKVITVTKTAGVKLPADTVRLTVTAAGSAKKYAEATAAAEKTADAAIAALDGAGVKLKARGMSVDNVYDGSKITGYRASISLRCEFAYKKELLGKALDALEKLPCEFDIKFALKNRTASKKLISEAVKAARETAEIIAAAAGESITGLAAANYESCTSAPVMFRAGPSADPDEIELSETVTCSFGIG